MNFLEELQNLDINDIGRWPLLFRALFIGILFALVLGGGFYYTIVKDKQPQLEKAELAEQEKRQQLENKQRKAANLEAYKQQLDEMNTNFGAMLRQLPGQTEIPGLLQDISQLGRAAALEEELFQPAGEQKRNFYAEKPISIRLRGSYHELGNFVSAIAALPRIVTLHDLDITPSGPTNQPNNGSDLVLNVTAKTYRYLDENEAE